MPCVESSSTQAPPCSSDIEETHTTESPEGHSTPPAADPGSADSVEEYNTGPHENGWVQRCQQTEKEMEDTGTALISAADAHGEKAEQVQKEHEGRAHQAWSEGHYFQAAKERVTGQAKHDLEKLRQAGDLVGAAAVATEEGAVQVLRGDKDQVQKVALGAAFVAAVPTGGASLSIASFTAAASAYQFTQSAGEMFRAEDRTEFAHAAFGASLAAMGPFVAGKIGNAIEAAIDEGELGPSLAKFFTDYAEREAPEIAQQFGPEAAKNFAEFLAEEGPEAVKHALELGLHHVVDAGAEKVADDIQDTFEED